ncbi:hypothetical protein KJ765_06450 [Candidatus Micrarchaeota archaeon]|nr:hypothetical protein [Candidatus Micrarchaeota archaeon]
MTRFKGSTEWTPIYMLIVFVIAAILIFTLVKPLLRNASNVAGGNLQEARQFASSAMWLVFK